MTSTVQNLVLPCPFCGSTPEVWDGAARKWVHVQCSNKKCVRPHDEGYYKHVVARWNRRQNTGGQHER